MNAQPQNTAASAPPTGMLAVAGEASELDRLLQQERVRAEATRNALEPKDFAEAQAFAKMIVDSGMFTDKDGRPPTVGSIMIRIMTGRQLGISSTIALQHVFDLYGRAGISAALKRSLVRRHPECERYEMLECDNEHCTWVVKRKGNTEKKFTFSMADAKSAQLVKKDGAYEKWARRMMQARASSEAADVEFPDACMGLASIEELLETVDAERMAPPVGAAVAGAGAGGPPPRDWAKETEEIRVKIFALFDQGNSKAARELYNLFAQEAPEAWANELKAAYNRALADHKAKGGGPKDSPPATATRDASVPSPAAGQQTLAGAEAYLPPGKRGDAYAGPDQPPPGWKP